jgi:steroid Delta-isomerase
VNAAVPTARDVSQASMAAVKARDKDAWLALWRDDGVVEDPVGPSFLDPTGEGHRGKDAIAAFWDANIGSLESVDFEIVDSFLAGHEVANVGTIHLGMPGGSTGRCEGVFVYRVDDDGKLVSLRAFWEVDRMMATVTG